MTNPPMKELRNGKTRVGIRPSIHLGTLIPAVSPITTNPDKYPPTIPPKNPAPIPLAVIPVIKPGAIPGLSAIE